MRITFNDGSYLELERSKTGPGKIWVTVAAKQQANPLELVVNSAEIEASQLIDALKTVTGPMMVERKEK